MADVEQRGRGRGGSRGRGRVAMKRPMSQSHEYEDFSGGFSKKRKIIDDVYRFLVREDLVKVVIGKGGAHIRAIKEEAKSQGTDTKVSVYAQCSNGTPLMEGARDRVMSVQTTTDGLIMALNHLTTSVQTHLNHRGAQSGHEGQKKQKLELRLLVPAHCCSAIIGKGGSVIKMIKEETSSYIQVYTLPMPGSDEHCVRIQNFEENDLIHTAFRVFEAIADIKGKSPVTMYDPIYFEQGEYGDTGSYVDTDWYQSALRSGVAKPTTFRDIRGAERGRGRGAARAAPYEDPYAEEIGYGKHGAGYKEAYEPDYGYDESYYTPAPRARGPPRGASRGMSRAMSRGRFDARGAPPGMNFRGRGPGGARTRGYPSQGPRGASRGRGAPRGRSTPSSYVQAETGPRSRGSTPRAPGRVGHGQSSPHGGAPNTSKTESMDFAEAEQY